MAFEDLREFIKEQALQLPIGGVVYTIKACSADDWLVLNASARSIDNDIRSGNLGSPIEGEDPETFFRRCLGDAFDVMADNNVTGQELQIAAMTAFFWHLGNEGLAEAVWVNAGKALSGDTSALEQTMKEQALPNRAARRATSSPSATRRATAESPKAKTTRGSSQKTA